MPYKERTFLRRYWPIGELAKELNVETHTVRFWANEIGLNPKRSDKKNGVRLFNVDERDRIILVRRLRSELGLPITKIKDVITNEEVANRLLNAI